MIQISGWHIDGFGVFKDYAVRELRPGLTVLLGPNEAGKSTLLAFLRYTLFGYPDGRSSEPRYQPLQGGPHGGRLFLTAPDGDYVVERTGGARSALRVAAPDGGAASEADLQRLLGNCDRKLFRAVFAFSLSELQRFQSLNEDGIREQIFAAGVTGAGQSARGALLHLREEQARLLKPRAAARINDLAREARELDAGLAAARRIADSYNDARLVEAERDSDVQALAGQLDLARSDAARSARLLALWPVWLERRHAEQSLAQLPPCPPLPADAEARLTRLRREHEVAAQTLTAVDGQTAELAARQATLRRNEALLAVAAEVETLYTELARWRAETAKLPALALARAAAEQTLRDKLHDLGPDWDHSRLAAFDRSIPRREDVRDFEERLATTQAALRQAEDALANVTRQRAQAQLARDRLAVDLATQPATLTLAVVEERETALGRLRAADVELAQLRGRAATLRDLLSGYEQVVRVAPESVPWSAPRWVGPAGWSLAVLLFVVALLSAASMPAVAVLLLVIAGAIVVGTRRLTRQTHRAAGSLGRVGAALDEGRLAQQQRLDREVEAIRALEQSLAQDSRRLDLTPPVDSAAIERAAHVVRQQRDAAHERARRERELGAADQELRDRAGQVDTARSARERAAQQAANAGAAWAGWSRAAGLPAQLSPAGALDFFEAARLGYEALRAAAAATSEERQLAAASEAFAQRIRATLTSAGAVIPAESSALGGALEQLRERVQTDRQARQQWDALADQLRDARANLETARAAASASSDHLTALFREAGAADESAFQQLLQTAQAATSWRDVLQQAERRLVEQIGEGPAADALRQTLATGALDDWRAAGVAAGERLAALEARREEAIEARRTAQLARETLEASASIAELAQRRSAVLAELEAAAREWRVRSLAEGLIQQALATFERERQPDVIAYASELFARVTDNAYPRLLAQPQGVAVVDAQGRQRQLSTLSRGAAEQLYLCIRFGLARAFARGATVLPLVLDDVLVNFDPERARGIAEALCAVAQERQVLLFTCHPHTAALLGEVDPACAHYTLQRFAGAGAWAGALAAPVGA